MPHRLTIAHANVNTLADILRWRTRQQPHERIYSFLLRGEIEAAHLTYADLDRRARAIGAVLQETHRSGERVLLWYTPGLEFVTAFFGCVYAGMTAVPISPPSSARPSQALTKLLSIVRDAQPRSILTSAALQAQWQTSDLLELQTIDWIATDTIADEHAHMWHDQPLSGDTPAFLQYTSGSTASPKGVMLSHDNLLYNLARIQRCFEHTPESKGVIWLPPHHDMGLIGGILQPLYVGFPVTLMSPITFLQAPLRWLTAISQLRATTSGGPNFAFDLCLRKITPEQRATLDLSSWSVAFTGAEPIRPQTLKRFAETFAECGFRAEAFYPCYGLAEATLIVTGGAKAALPMIQPFQTAALSAGQAVPTSEEEPTLLVGCGQIQPEDQVRIVDPATGVACQAGQIGEIWIAGPCVAQGYWNNSEATRQTFAAQLEGSSAGPFLRTGDLGFIRNGELFITGRLKDLIIIRGRNHYPQDIELTVEQSHVALQPHAGAAFSVEIDGEERLVIVQEVSRQHRAPDVADITNTVRQAIAEQHDLQVYAVVLIKPGSIPKTSSGKIQRYACRTGFLQGTLTAVGQSILTHDPDAAVPLNAEAVSLLQTINQQATAQERHVLVARHLRQELAHRLRIASAQIADQQALSALGLDSLAAVEIRYHLETELGVLLPIDQLLSGLTVSQLAAEIVQQLEQPPVGTLPGSAGQQFAPDLLSHGQQALWFLHQLAPTSVAYHIVSAARISGDLDVALLERCFQALVDRHAALRTTFEAPAGEPRRRVHAQRRADFHYEDASMWSETALNQRIAAEAYHPFDLMNGPLLRVRLFERTAHDYVVLLTVHHIIADFWSLALLFHELDILYTAEKNASEKPLPLMQADYGDYVHWQRALLASTEGASLRSYWMARLAGDLPTLRLPTDRPRPPLQTYNGATHSFKLEPRLTQTLKSFSQAGGATLYMTLLTAFYALLYRYTGQIDILVGSPTADRRHARFAGVVGYLVNPVVMRGDLSGEPSFEILLSRIRQTVLEAFAHQAYPFPLLVEDLQLARDPSHSPLFQVMFVMQKAQSLLDEHITALAFGTPGAAIRLDDLRVESVELEQSIAQFDLTLAMAELGESLTASFQYNTDLFDADTIRRLADHFLILLRGMVDQPLRRISDLPLLTAAEHRQIVGEWNATATSYPEQIALHTLIEEQAERSADAPAVIFEGQTLTYSDLNRRANQVAHYLRSRGVGPDVLVGVHMERSLELVIALLGILKAGGAYVPLDPSYPQERLAWIIEDSRAALLLTQDRLASMLPAGLQPSISLDTHWSLIADQPADNPRPNLCAQNLAYMIYTSGSTGRPKGAMNTHQAIVNRLLWMQDTFQLTADDRVVQKTPFSFDVSVWEFFWPLLSGACLVVARPEGHRDPSYLVDLIIEHQITTLHFVPSMLQAFLEAPKVADITSLRRVICSGEALSFELQERFFARLAAELHNLYGPTEAAVDVTAWQCRPASRRSAVPLGYPIANTQVYILDARLQPVPIGVAGEIYLGGVQLARGYYRRADLTAERFLPNPFAAGTRLYRTGDLGRYLPDGAIEYLGRIDFQVKLRGFRIELGEIEAVLHEHAAVREAVVVAHEAAGATALTAYIVAADGLPERALRDFLKERLPEYMIPTTFMRLPALPLTPNGKLDRRALPIPELERPDLESEFVAPRTPTEEKLAAIWAELLRVERVGIHDNFFALGGHSLLVTQIASRVRDVFNVEIPMRALFQGPTIASLAMTITQLRAAQAGSDAIERMLKQISHLPPEQVQALLAAKKGTPGPVMQAQPVPANQQAAAPARPVRDALVGAGREAYRCADIQRFPLGGGSELISVGHGTSRIVASETAAWLEQCTTFKTIDDHALTLARRDSSTDAQTVAAIEEQLRDLRKDGLLLSYAETLNLCTAASAPPSAPTEIATIAWPTANRVTILQRCLTSYIENTKQYGKTNDYAILDDSQSAETRQAYQDMLRSVANQHKVRIFYGGIEQKTRFAKRIIDTGDIPADIVRFALFGEPQGPYRAGANVNAVMLHTAGDPVLCVDDDTVGRVTPAPGRTDGVSLTSGRLANRGLGGTGYPDEIWSFPDRETLLREIRFVDTDLLGMHEQLLGQSVREYLSAAQRNGHTVDVHDVDPQLLRRLSRAGGRVMVTLPGLVGDCGWGTPSNYLQFSGNSLERLAQSEATYRSACTSRELLRVATKITLAKNIETLIGSCYGLDNRFLVPPSMPIAIGIDTIFGVTISKCFDNGYFAHLPNAILHLPGEERTFWPGEILRSASGIAFNTLVYLLINFFDFGLSEVDGEAKLRRLGHYLEEAGSLAAPDFEDLMRSQIQRGVSLYLLTLESQLQLHRGQPAYWANDLQQFMTIMRQSLLQDRFYVPLDLLYGRSLNEARQLTQHFVRRLGQLMYWWPDIVEVARGLRNQGYRLADPV